MNRTFVLLLLIIAAWGGAYLDWLAPGWLKFELPAAWNKPFTTQTTYDFTAGAPQTKLCAVWRATSAVTPNWLEAWHRRSPLPTEQKPCQLPQE